MRCSAVCLCLQITCKHRPCLRWAPVWLPAERGPVCVTGASSNAATILKCCLSEYAWHISGILKNTTCFCFCWDVNTSGLSATLSSCCCNTEALSPVIKTGMLQFSVRNRLLPDVRWEDPRRVDSGAVRGGEGEQGVSGRRWGILCGLMSRHNRLQTVVWLV